MNGKRILAGLMTITMTFSSVPAGAALERSLKLSTVQAEDISTSQALDAAKKVAAAKQQELAAAQALVEQYEAVATMYAAKLKSAEDEKLSAEAALETATQTLNDAKTALEETQNTCENIDTLIEAAKTAKTNADSNVLDAQDIFDSKKAAVDSAAEEYTNASDMLDELKTTKDNSDENASALKTAYETAKSNYDSLKEDYDEKKEALDTANAELDEAKDNLTDAETAYNAAKTTYEDENTKATELKTSYDTALSRKEKGTYGFFESRNDTVAMSALTTCKYKDYIQLGADDDATSLDNMEHTFDYIRELNTMRKNVGLGELKVTSTLMAQAQADADYSDTVVAHAQQFSVAENVAWNYGSDPYKQWYDAEKAAFDKKAAELGQTTELTGAAAYNYYTANSSSLSFSTYGHYLNDINPNYKYTGFAYMNRGTMNNWKTYAQVFSGSTSETSYTVDEYEELFNEYKKGIDKAITDYNGAVTARDNAYTAMTAAEDTKKAAGAIVTSKQTAYDAAEEAYNTIKTKSEQANTAMQTAKQDYDEAIEKASIAATAYTAQNKIAEDKKSDLETANSELVKAETDLEDAKTAQTTTTEKLSSLQYLSENKEQILQEMETAITTADADKTAKEQTVQSALVKYTDAQEKATESQKALNSAKQTSSAALTAYNTALASVQAAQTAYDNEKQTSTSSTTTPADSNEYTDLTADDDEETTFVSGTATYEVTNEGSEVEYVKLNKQKATSAVVPATISYKGVTYKVTSIGSKAFYNCKQLKTVTVGANVESIGSKAFYNTKKLTKITIKTKKLTADEVSSTAFKRAGKNLGKKLVIKVPASKKKLYKKIIKNGGFKIR